MARETAAEKKAREEAEAHQAGTIVVAPKTLTEFAVWARAVAEDLVSGGDNLSGKLKDLATQRDTKFAEWEAAINNVPPKMSEAMAARDECGYLTQLINVARETGKAGVDRIVSEFKAVRFTAGDAKQLEAPV